MDKIQQAIAFIENMNNLEAQGAPIDYKEVVRRIAMLLKAPDVVPEVTTEG